MRNFSEKAADAAFAIAIAGLLVIAVIGAIAIVGPAGCSRAVKSFESNMNNGLNRTFTVYDYDGKKVFEDSGTLDYVYQDGKWYYDKDGKRTSVSGGIVIVQEVGK